MKKIWGVVVGVLLVASSVGHAAAQKGPPAKMEVSGTINTIDVSPGDAKDVACAPYDESRTSDLCAQWKAADAAKSGATASWWAFMVGTVINLVTLIVVSLTFRETRKTIRNAEENTRIAKTALSADARAWLDINITPDKNFVAVDIDNEFEALVLEGKIGVKNNGRSPAIAVQVYADIGFDSFASGNYREIIENFCEECLQGKESFGTGIFPDVTFNTTYSDFVIPREDLAKYRDFCSMGRFPNCYVVTAVVYRTPHVEDRCVTGYLHFVNLRDPKTESDVRFPRNPRKWADHPVAFSEAISTYVS